MESYSTDDILFRAGDVRAGAMNRVAPAVGKGSMAITYVHKYFGDTKANK